MLSAHTASAWPATATRLASLTPGGDGAADGITCALGMKRDETRVPRLINILGAHTELALRTEAARALGTLGAGATEARPTAQSAGSATPSANRGHARASAWMGW
jgi:hypothetical protein